MLTVIYHFRYADEDLEAVFLVFSFLATNVTKIIFFICFRLINLKYKINFKIFIAKNYGKERKICTKEKYRT
ncbi:hypothetical protein SDC9_94169 [bioreactor metagenome]|uniref:Uncharacterized protein n=1 Tax=bioreactor metagenome TaxID=1076179 RepID=A0A645A2P0_9ZZZZ